MAIDVNPPPQPQLPKEFAENKSTRLYFKSLTRFLLQIWERTGGGEDLIDNTEQGLTSTSSRVSRNAAKINALEKTTFDIVPITADYTTGPQEIVKCNNTSRITVTLDPNAIEEDEVHIKRANKVVDVIGLIDGKQDRVINVKGFSLDLIYDGTEWLQI